MEAVSNCESSVRQRVTYILGCSHSGSTILTIALGTHSKIFAAGEVSNLIRDGWLRHRCCSCGEGGDVCKFWSEVRRQWTGQHGADVLLRYIELQQRFERLRSLPRLLWAIRCGDAPFRDYARLSATLFTTIQRLSGASLIVDSSKSPVRALALAATRAFDLSIVHLVRDPRGVVWSYRKPKSANPHKGIPTTAHGCAFYWLIINLLSSCVRRFSGVRSLVLRYEHYARSPRAALQTLGEHVALDLTEVAGNLEHGTSFRAEHCIAGNRVRMAKSIHLAFDDQWRRDLPRRERWIVAILTAGLRRLYAPKHAAQSSRGA